MESERIKIATRLVLDEKAVRALPRNDWDALVRADGTPTVLDDAPAPLDGVSRDAHLTCAAASGVLNPDPGIDLIRYDPDDHPYIYNIDHYLVIEDITAHPRYAEFLDAAGVEDSALLRQELGKWVYTVGPQKLPDHHWSVEIPKHIRDAKRREEP